VLPLGVGERDAELVVVVVVAELEGRTEAERVVVVGATLRARPRRSVHGVAR
jgi:hypothetical protein